MKKNTNDSHREMNQMAKKHEKKILNLTTNQENVNLKVLDILFWPPDNHKLLRL